MRRIVVSAAVGILLIGTLGTAGSASAVVMDVLTTITTKLGFNEPVILTGAGVATLETTNGTYHLKTIQISPLPPNGGVAIPVTDPDVNATIVSNIIDEMTPAGGTFAPISGGGPLTQNTMPVMGMVRVCLFFPGCGTFIELPLSINSGATAVGVGGLIAVGTEAIRISLFNAPWQISTATLSQSTHGGAIITRTAKGFAYGPAFNTSSTALTGGMIQFVTPTQVKTEGIADNYETQALFISLTLRFVPEPSLILLLGSGVVGLVLIGRGRMRK